MQTIYLAEDCSQRPQHSRPELSSKIVRPVFQRRVSTMDRDDEADSRATRGVKRPSTPEADSYHSGVLPLNSGYTQPAGSYVPSRFSVTRDAPTARYLSSKTVDALRMVTNNAQTDSSEPKKPQQKRVRLKTERRREQCRANQARYRQKQLNHAKELEATVQKLRADIPVLELQRHRLLYGGQQNVWNVVVEYFHVFRFGVPVALPVQSAENADATVDYLENAETKHQLAFLRSSMTEDVILGERSGVDALMDQWRRYSTSFQSLYFQLDRIERVGDKFVSVTAMMNVTVSDATLKGIFPHVTSDYSLSSRLLGKLLRIPFSVCFEWDSTSCRVSRLETTINFVAPLMEALDNVADVALVLERALITRDGAVGVSDL